MSKQIGTIKDLKEGRYVIIDGEACKVTKITKSKPGKHGGMKARVEGVGLFDNQKRNIMGPVDQKIEIPQISKDNAQVLNVLGENVQLMDMSSYETFELPVPEEYQGKLTQGQEILVLSALGQRKIIQL
ncbi:MAG: translation initiation factor IF-5A [Candidatus Altiarchaeales archaeon ex4484_96]|nr:MAG: translation initiation factor IF-5A [Candidatus Altiarchaeales archaeon ex4484_96]